MSDDLVERLRAEIPSIDAHCGDHRAMAIVAEAADRIEQLTRERDKARNVVEKLRAPARGPGPQTVLVTDIYRTYGELLDGYSQLEADVASVAVERDQAQAENEQLRTLLADFDNRMSAWGRTAVSMRDARREIQTALGWGSLEGNDD